MEWVFVDWWECLTEWEIRWIMIIMATVLGFWCVMLFCFVLLEGVSGV